MVGRRQKRGHDAGTSKYYPQKTVLLSLIKLKRSSKLKKTSGNQFDQYARNVGLK